MAEILELSGNALRLSDVERIARAETTQVQLAAGARARVLAARAVVDQVIRDNRVVYGISTGFGALAEVVIPP
ncbi:MAG TPA: aromatic amino acid lyase, partial [Longimicrobiales bacterium]